MIILGIETSCDETAAAVVENGDRILSSVVASQIDVHRAYGGVVPELASRKHMEAIAYVVDEAIRQSGINEAQIDAVAATQGPGLIGALVVGFSFAKAFAFAKSLPLIGVNHLEGHIHSVFLEPNPPSFPFVSLLVSGGHTGIYHVLSHTETHLLGQTRDDAAGEAFDKVAKMLNLGYPGGGIISKLASQGDPKKITFPFPYVDKSNFDFSFSGIKTAVNRYIQKNSDIYLNQIADIAAAFQESVVEVLTYKIIHAAEITSCHQISIVGGVAANKRLREKVCIEARARNISVYIPRIELCGDNAAMIAANGYHKLVNGQKSMLCEDVYSKVRSKTTHKIK